MLGLAGVPATAPHDVFAGLEHRQAAIRTVCTACGVMTNAVGTAIYLRAGGSPVHPFTSSGFCGEEIAELQSVLGDGPAFEAIRHNWPVFVPNLVDHATSVRWPLFSAAAVSAGVEAVFVFPLTVDSAPLGAFEIHRDTGDVLTPDEIVDVVHLAAVVLNLLLDVPP
ncbi:GAF domain-containing protein [Lentzea sp. NPDC059081]|uniref:GAF domain-containing protein n=1 Tax=Lentzea sp. NPDC059081 TaxID=3346719 RepID=UPI0036CE61A3